MMAKPLQEFPSVFGGHFISVNISARKDEGSLLFIGIHPSQSLRSRKHSAFHNSTHAITKPDKHISFVDSKLN